MESKQTTVATVPVEFRFTRASYLRSDKLFCYFHIPNLAECHPEGGDWIAIYKVGWANLKDFKVRKHVTLQCVEKCLVSKLAYGTMMFETCELPKELGCSYQFVYVCKSGVMRGISKPFVFESVPSFHCKDDFFSYPETVYQNMFDDLMTSRRSPTCSENDYEIIGRPESIDDLIRHCGTNTETVTTPMVPTKTCKSVEHVVKPTTGHMEHEDFLSLLQNCLTMKPVIDDHNIEYKKVQELLTENAKMRLSLDCKNEEIVELKREKKELKMCNTDMLSKLNICESEIEKVTVEREHCITKVMEVLRVMFNGYPSHFDQIINAERKLDMLERERDYLMAEIKTNESSMPFRVGTEAGKYHKTVPSSWLVPRDCGVTGSVKSEEKPKTVGSQIRTEVTSKPVVPSVPVSTKVPEVCHKVEKPICKKVEEPFKVKSIGEHINEYIAKSIEKPMDSITKPCEVITKPCETITKPCETITKPCETLKCAESKTPMVKYTKPVDCQVTMPESKFGRFIMDHEKMMKEHKPRLWKEWFLEECKPTGTCDEITKMTSSPSMEHIICPMCGIAITKESAYEFELHVNSHFTD